MKVRNRLYKKTEYDGTETDASDGHCPCRSCYHPHNFAYIRSDGKKIDRWMCLTRERGGCPDDKPEAEHIRNPRTKFPLCKRCGCLIQ